MTDHIQAAKEWLESTKEWKDTAQPDPNRYSNAALMAIAHALVVLAERAEDEASRRE